MKSLTSHCQVFVLQFLNYKLQGGKSIAKIIMIELQTVLNCNDRDRQAPLQIRKTTSKLSSSGTKPTVGTCTFLHMVKYQAIKQIKFENPLHQ